MLLRLLGFCEMEKNVLLSTFYVFPMLLKSLHSAFNLHFTACPSFVGTALLNSAHTCHPRHFNCANMLHHASLAIYRVWVLSVSPTSRFTMFYFWFSTDLRQVLPEQACLKDNWSATVSGFPFVVLAIASDVPITVFAVIEAARTRKQYNW